MLDPAKSYLSYNIFHDNDFGVHHITDTSIGIDDSIGINTDFGITDISIHNDD